MPDFLQLSCKSCGAKLEVYNDMDRFACSYCGTELLVQRRGNTVNLKLVTDAIEKVQAGTDKTRKGPISPNAPCPCASYKTFKKCCMYKS